jgi:hypothetical protein
LGITLVTDLLVRGNPDAALGAEGIAFFRMKEIAFTVVAI